MKLKPRLKPAFVLKPQPKTPVQHAAVLAGAVEKKWQPREAKPLGEPLPKSENFQCAAMLSGVLGIASGMFAGVPFVEGSPSSARGCLWRAGLS
jgi:hypothetical protein